MFLTVLCFGRLFSVALGIKFFNPPELWELIWLLSGLCAYVGYGSLSKNHAGQLLTYLFGNVVFGLSMLVYGAWSILQRSLSLFRKGNSFDQWKSAPTRVALIAVCLQVQLVGLYHGIKLYRACCRCLVLGAAACVASPCLGLASSRYGVSRDRVPSARHRLKRRRLQA